MTHFACTHFHAFARVDDDSRGRQSRSVRFGSVRFGSVRFGVGVVVGASSPSSSVAEASGIETVWVLVARG
jgi:hypothetical protein